MKKLASFQKWLPFKEILSDGVIILKDNTYVKLIRVFPINYNLKSELEKKSILNSFKIFFKTCDFDMQVLIQSTKEDLSNYIFSLEEEQKNEENKEIQWMYKKYINFINDKNSQNKFSSKNFIIVIKKVPEKVLNNESINITDLNDKYHKIRECLSKCGNSVIEFSREEVINMLYNCFNNN